MTHALGLFGGSFDPVHNGHLIAVRAVAERLSLSDVILLPSATPPHKSATTMAPGHHREAMLRLAVEGEDLFSVSTFDLARSGPTYTIDTIEHFRAEAGPQTQLCWIIGGDSLAELHTWYRIRDLAEQCRIVTAVRPGWETPDLTTLQSVIGEARLRSIERDVLDTPRVDISATDVRRRVGVGLSIRYLVPDSVRRYVVEHGLYGR